MGLCLAFCQWYWPLLLAWMSGDGSGFRELPRVEWPHVHVALADMSYRRCGAVALHLRRVSQPRNHRNRDPVAFGDGRQCLPVSAALDGFLALVGRKLSRPAELDARSHSPLRAFSSAFTDQIAFKVGYGG